MCSELFHEMGGVLWESDASPRTIHGQRPTRSQDALSLCSRHRARKCILPEPISCSGVRRSGAFASDNHVLRASLRVVDVIAYVENFRSTFLNVAL